MCAVYVSMVVFVFAVRAGELSWQMLIVHKHVDLKKSIQLSPLRRWRMDRIHEKAHDMMAFLVAIENPVTNIFKTTLTAKFPQIHPPSGVQHRGKLIYQYSVGVLPPSLFSARCLPTLQTVSFWHSFGDRQLWNPWPNPVEERLRLTYSADRFLASSSQSGMPSLNNIAVFF